MEIPYGKLVVYALTLIGYVYSGYGSGLLNNLKDAVLSAENVFGDVMKNVIAMANNVKSLNDVFEAAVDEHCVFKCPNEDVTPRPNKNHRPSANGCGSLGLKIDAQQLPVADMTKCCDAHDICYDTCNNDKEVCDVEFRRCLYKICESYQKKLGDTMVKGCKGAAKVLYTGTLTLGCKSYIDAQSNACYCAPQKESKKNYKYTKGGGEL